MKVLIAGGRHYHNRAWISTCLVSLPAGSVVIHGGCPTGADKIADEEAHRLGLEVRAYPVDHSVDGPWPGAGPRRNERMIAAEHHPDEPIEQCFFFPDSESRGTWDAHRRAGKRGIPCMICPEVGERWNGGWR